MIRTMPTYTSISFMLTCFSLSSVVYLISLVFGRSTKLRDWDRASTWVARFAGLAVLLLWLLNVGDYFFMDPEAVPEWSDVLFGERWFVFWFIPVSIIIGSQTLWWSVWNQSIVGRIVSSTLLLIPTPADFEKFVIVITSLHRDFIPASSEANDPIWDWVLALVIQVLVYLLIVQAVYWLRKARQSTASKTN